MEKSLLKQALRIGMDEGWTIRLLFGGEPPLWRALSRESSVPLEDWLTISTTENQYRTISTSPTLEHWKECVLHFTFKLLLHLPVDELEVSACRMESACRVAIIFSISSACCSRPTSSRASSAVKQRQKLKKWHGKNAENVFRSILEKKNP